MIIDMFTRKQVSIGLDIPTTPLEAMLIRFSDKPDVQNWIKRLQSTVKGPYNGPCTSGLGGNYMDKVPFPIANWSVLPQDVLGHGILDASEPDPFNHLDRKYQIAYNIMSHATLIYTRSDLIAHDDYIARLNPKVNINIVFSTDNEERLDELEPGSPSLKRRLRAYEKLTNLGFTVKLINLHK